jgi:hypothetical protein
MKKRAVDFGTKYCINLQGCTCRHFLSGYFLVYYLYTGDGESIFLRNVYKYVRYCTTLRPQMLAVFIAYNPLIYFDMYIALNIQYKRRLNNNWYINISDDHNSYIIMINLAVMLPYTCLFQFNLHVYWAYRATYILIYV